MTGIDRLILAYNDASLNDSSREILGWILQHLNRVGECSIYALAEETFTSTATISRLVRKLGYSNYRFFQKDVEDSVRQYEFHNRLLARDQVPAEGDAVEIVLSLTQRLLDELREKLNREDVHRLVDLIHERDRIALYLYEEVTAKHFLQFDLFAQGKLCDALSDEGEILEHSQWVGKDHLVLVFAAYHLKRPDIEEVLQNLRKSGATVCFVTDSPHYAAQVDAELKFVIPGAGSGLDMLLTELFLDLVVIEHRQRYCDA